MGLDRGNRAARRGGIIKLLLAALVACETVNSPSTVASIVCDAIFHQQSRVYEMAGEAILDTAAMELRRDKRGGSRVGRCKRRARVPCRWPQLYLDPATCVYTPQDFRDTFGVSKEVFRYAARANSFQEI
jgi:hypothetical protein